MYVIGTGKDTDEQVAALPAQALAPLQEALVLLEVAPWTGVPFVKERPDAPVRSLTFGEGGAGLITYLIIEYRRRVELISIVWV
ncbi:hypothetical protein [Herbidospora daliensis]|uniref:hypothetical protein n=1 Tax=Herbidospora daliensis TaxID=295585 RepID=UPI000785FA77|nr:hypothetical protein [Herbidospora daliensis]